MSRVNIKNWHRVSYRNGNFSDIPKDVYEALKSEDSLANREQSDEIEPQVRDSSDESEPDTE